MRILYLGLCLLSIAATINGCDTSSAQSIPDLTPKSISATILDLDTREAVRLPNGRLLLSAVTLDSGIELVVTDGTEEGTTIIDVLPGPESGIEYWNTMSPLFNMGYYFVAKDSVGGHEFWFTDGTPEGTIVVCDCLPGNSRLMAPPDYILEPGRLTAVVSIRAPAPFANTIGTRIITFEDNRL